MNDNFDYNAWRLSLAGRVTELTANFESRFGYSPDDHEIGGPSSEQILEEARGIGPS